MNNVPSSHPESGDPYDAHMQSCFTEIVSQIGFLATPSVWNFEGPKRDGFDPRPRTVRPELLPDFQRPTSAYYFPEPRTES